MTKIAVIGPGAIGGMVSAWLQKAGYDLTICARSGFENLVVETPDGTFLSKPEVLTNKNAATPVDWVLATTKTYDVNSAAEWLPHLLKNSTKVAVLQNGVEHVEKYLPFVPRDRIVPVIVNVPAERLGVGHFLQRSREVMTVSDGPNGKTFKDFFREAPVTVDIVSDFDAVAWRKLAINSAGAVSALALKPASVVSNPSAAMVMRSLIQECISVGQAAGVDIDSEFVETVMKRYRGHAPDVINSLLADRMAGRPMEIDARNGVIVRLGKIHGVPTPVNSLIVALLEASAS